MSQAAKIKHRQFAEKIMLELKRPAEAYAEIYGHDASDATSRVNASKLLTDTNIQEYIVELSNVYKALAEWALTEQVALALNVTTPAAVKNQIFEAIQERAGYSRIQRIHTTIKEEKRYPEFTFSVEQLHSIINQAKNQDDV